MLPAVRRQVLQTPRVAISRTFAAKAHLDDSSYSHYSLKLSDEQREFQQLARKFAREEMIPKEKYYDQTMEYPQEIFEKAWELGLVNSHVPEVRTLLCSTKEEVTDTAPLTP